MNDAIKYYKYEWFILYFKKRYFQMAFQMRSDFILSRYYIAVCYLNLKDFQSAETVFLK